MAQHPSMMDKEMLTCWWCNEPADPSSVDHLRVSLEKVTWFRKHSETEKTQITIPRCKNCKSIQSKETNVEALIGGIVLIAGALGCYIGNLIQGKTGWVSWVLGIGIPVILGGILAVIVARRTSRKSTEEAKFPAATGKSYTDYLPVKTLVKDGWKIVGKVT